MNVQSAFLFGGREKDGVIYIVTRQAWRYRDDFARWLSVNWEIWLRFEREADAIYAMGRTHYSARTIFEVLRHETALRERGGDYKLDNGVIPDCARLYMTLKPERKNFFELRDGQARAAA